MKIYLMQHGQALSKQQDPNRPLSVQGRRHVEQLASFLRAEQSMHLYHSGKTRTQQSAEILAQSLNIKDLHKLETIRATANIEDFLPSLGELKDGSLLVSHMPFVNLLAKKLLNSKGNFNFVPGSLMCLELEGEMWSLQYMLGPAQYCHD